MHDKQKTIRPVIVFMVVLTISGLALSTAIGGTQPRERIQLAGEVITVKGNPESGFVIVSQPSYPLSLRDYGAYKARRAALLNGLPDQQNAEAIISPKTALTPAEYLAFMTRHRDLQPLAFAYYSNKPNSGLATIRPGGGGLDTVIPLREREDSLKQVHGKDFILVYRIYGIRVLGSGASLREAQGDTAVDLVDVGPLDVFSRYSALTPLVRMEWQFIYAYLHSSELDSPS